MKCIVNGELTAARNISYRELNFGQSVSLPLYPYMLEFPFPELLDFVGEDASAFVFEAKLDFVRDGDTHPAYLHDIGYLPLDRLVEYEDAFCQLIQDFLCLDLFRKCFPLSCISPEVFWLINSVDFVRYHEGNVELAGLAFPVRNADGVNESSSSQQGRFFRRALPDWIGAIRKRLGLKWPSKPTQSGQ